MEKEKEFNKIFSQRLRYYLSMNNMTQAELAKRLNVGTTSVYNWCNGIKNPRMNKVDAMCRIFGCRRIDLVTDTDLEPAEQDSLRECLLKNYDCLNEEGRQRLVELSEDLVAGHRYEKNILSKIL